MSVSENLRRGSVDLVLLALLNEQEMYGYQLVQEMGRRSDGEYTLTESTLYPVLYRLEDKKFISSRRQLIGKRRVRVYYRIEPAGKEYYSAIRQEYLASMRGIMRILNESGGGSK